jgi:hypothetical protein
MAVSLTRRPPILYPQEDSWYSFLLDAESTPGPSAAAVIIGELIHILMLVIVDSE